MIHIHTSINVMYHLLRMKDKHLIIISIDAEKPFDKIQHRFMLKTLCKEGLEGRYFSIMKAIYGKPTANIIRKNLKVFCLRSGTSQACSFPTLLFNKVLKVLTTTIRQEREIKGIQVEMEKVKPSLFADCMMRYRENPKDSMKKLLEHK